MKILVINSGSSSIKFQLIEMPEKKVLASGMVERIGLDQSKVQLHVNGNNFEQIREISNHEQGLELVAKLLLEPSAGLLKNADEIDAVGHRVVHGGSSFSQTVVINEEVKVKIKELFSLAPLHNPHNFKGIEVSEKIFKRATQIAVFDTAFHQTIPKRAHIYALPYELYERHRVRRYGFHGTSHKFVAGECARLMGRQLSEINLITIHLGNGCSMSAIEHGCSVDTSLGMTPLEGLVMGTRSGDVDPAIHSFLQRTAGMDLVHLRAPAPPP